MSQSIFESESYKAYLDQALELRSASEKGQRSKLAAHIGCHTAYVSQVLNGDVHFSLEQAEKINSYLGHGKDEGLYFLTLVQFERAGTPSLRAIFKEQLGQQLKKFSKLNHRLEFEKTIGLEEQATYYSAWYYAAIHVMVSLPGLDNHEALTKSLNLPSELVAQVLDFLTSSGLIKKSGRSYLIGTKSIHVTEDSPLISRHHINWRLHAMQTFQVPAEGDFHYTSVITISKKDATKLREIMMKAIQEMRPIVRASKDEAGYCYNLDLFRVGR